MRESEGERESITRMVLSSRHGYPSGPGPGSAGASPSLPSEHLLRTERGRGPSRPSPPAAALELIAAASCSCNCNCSCNCSCRRAIVGTSWCPSWVSPSSRPGGPSEASQPALTRQSQQFVWYRVAKSQHCTNCKRFYSFSSSVAPTRPELSRQSQL